jgi:hypothetical protein
MLRCHDEPVPHGRLTQGNWPPAKPARFNVTRAKTSSVLRWSKTWKSKVQPFCIHWLA